jgi:hypothetical protein
MRFILICSNLICIATTVALPAQCTSATVINDPTRNVNYAGGAQCDSSTGLVSTGWYKFTGSGGTTIINYPPGLSQCNTVCAGWYSGSYPSTVGSTTSSGTICYVFISGATCQWSNPVQVTNCNGYYVYYLTPPPTCALGLCIS